MYLSSIQRVLLFQNCSSEFMIQIVSSLTATFLFKEKENYGVCLIITYFYQSGKASARGVFSAWRSDNRARGCSRSDLFCGKWNIGRVKEPSHPFLTEKLYLLLKYFGRYQMDTKKAFGITCLDRRGTCKQH